MSCCLAEYSKRLFCTSLFAAIIKRGSAEGQCHTIALQTWRNRANIVLSTLLNRRRPPLPPHSLIIYLAKLILLARSRRPDSVSSGTGHLSGTGINPCDSDRPKPAAVYRLPLVPHCYSRPPRCSHVWHLLNSLHRCCWASTLVKWVTTWLPSSGNTEWDSNLVHLIPLVLHLTKWKE